MANLEAPRRGRAALVAAVLTVLAVRGRVHETLLDPKTLAEK